MNQQFNVGDTAYLRIYRRTRKVVLVEKLHYDWWQVSNIRRCPSLRETDFVRTEKLLTPEQVKIDHRRFLAKVLGRPLLSHEQVHHKDGNHYNNDLSNLQIVTPSEHARIHGGGRIEICAVCCKNTWRPPALIRRRKSEVYICKQCRTRTNATKKAA